MDGWVGNYNGQLLHDAAESNIATANGEEVWLSAR